MFHFNPQRLENREHPDLPDDPAMTMYYVSRMHIAGPILMILQSSDIKIIIICM